MSVHGLLLAAGEGRRMGQPKALVTDADGAWLPRSVRTLLDGGCDAVTVVLGASADQARPLLDGLGPDHRARVEVVTATDWADGMGASLRAGLRALDGVDGASAALVHLVDLPDVGEAVVDRVLSRVLASGRPLGEALARAAYAGTPGHPVLLGRDHWAGAAAGADGDAGAKAYLADHDPLLVECGDLAGGADVDSR